MKQRGAALVGNVKQHVPSSAAIKEKGSALVTAVSEKARSDFMKPRGSEQHAPFSPRRQLVWSTEVVIEYEEKALGLRLRETRPVRTSNGEYYAEIECFPPMGNGTMGPTERFNFHCSEAGDGHLALFPGYRLIYMNDVNLDGMEYQDIVSEIRCAGRPLILRFADIASILVRPNLPKIGERITEPPPLVVARATENGIVLSSVGGMDPRAAKGRAPSDTAAAVTASGGEGEEGASSSATPPSEKKDLGWGGEAPRSKTGSLLFDEPDQMEAINKIVQEHKEQQAAITQKRREEQQTAIEKRRAESLDQHVKLVETTQDYARPSSGDNHDSSPKPGPKSDGKNSKAHMLALQAEKSRQMVERELCREVLLEEEQRIKAESASYAQKISILRREYKKVQVDMDSMQKEIEALVSGRATLHTQIATATEQARKGTNAEKELKKTLRKEHESLVVDVEGLRHTVADMEQTCEELQIKVDKIPTPSSVSLLAKRAQAGSLASDDAAQEVSTQTRSRGGSGAAGDAETMMWLEESIEDLEATLAFENESIFDLQETVRNLQAQCDHAQVSEDTATRRASAHQVKKMASRRASAPMVNFKAFSTRLEDDVCRTDGVSSTLPTCPADRSTLPSTGSATVKVHVHQRSPSEGNQEVEDDMVRESSHAGFTGRLLFGHPSAPTFPPTFLLSWLSSPFSCLPSVFILPSCLPARPFPSVLPSTSRTFFSLPFSSMDIDALDVATDYFDSTTAPDLAKEVPFLLHFLPSLSSLTSFLGFLPSLTSFLP
jgi:hypothetical protein